MPRHDTPAEPRPLRAPTPRNEPRRDRLDGRCDPRPRKPAMSADARQLAGQNHAYALFLAKPFCEDHPGLAEDLRSEALLALCESAVAFLEDVGTPFSAYARPGILGALRNAVDRHRRAGLVGTGDAPAVVPMTRPEAAEDTSPPEPEGTDPGGAGAVGCGDVDADADPFELILLPLRPREREAIRATVRDGLSYEDAAGRLGCSVSAVDHLRRAALAKLRAAAG